MKQGTITGISGPVIDVRFPEGTLPAINEALTVQVDALPTPWRWSSTWKTRPSAAS